MRIELTIANKMRTLVQKRGADALPAGFVRSIENFDKAAHGFFADPQTADSEKLQSSYLAACAMFQKAGGDSR